MPGIHTLRRDAATATAVLVLASILLLASAVPAFGASVPLTVDSMTVGARAVVVGECVSATSRLLDPAAGPRGGIVTDVVVRVDETITGTAADTFTITQPGGEVGGIGLFVTEVPVFNRGRDYVVFLGANGQVVGGTQGALALAGNRVAATGQTLSSLKRRVKAAAGTPMTLAEVFADTIVARVAEAAPVQIAPLATPVIVSMSPSNQSAGTGSVVAISGTGFAASQGAGSVDFYRDSTTDVTAVVTSWSDTSIVCEVPEGAGSGAVTVTNGSGLTSANYTYDVGFSYGGAKWADGTLTETYRINANTADTASEHVLVDAAAATWGTVSNFSFTDGGTCASTANPTTYDGYNDIYWASSGFTSNNTLAWNRYWYYLPDYEIFETDIVFNDYWPWGEGTGNNTIDIQTIALHELGHSLNLGDQYGPGDSASNKVMFGMSSDDFQRRSLSQDDIDGIRWIYGSTGDTTPPAMGAVSSATHPVDTTWYASNDPSFSWSATDANAITYSYAIDHISGTVPDSTPDGTATTVTYTDLADGEWYLHVRARDEAGNWSLTTSQRRVRIDSTAPTGSFTIAAGASQTATTSATVNSSVTGATEMSIAADGITFGTWQAYAAVRNIVLPAGEGMKTVAVRYRDAVLNTATFTDTIELDYELVARDFTWTAIAGSDRYATALAVSRSAFATGSCDTVIIATGTNFPDALGAGGLAGAARCPILLVRSTGGLPTAVKNEINRLTQGHTTRKVYITGSTTVVSALTETNLKSLVGSTNVKRLGGADRFATANLIAREVGIVLTAKGIPYSGEAFVTTGLTFPDALLASPVAYAEQRPVLLIGKAGVDSALRATITALGITDIEIVGSTASVSTSVQTALDGISGVSVERVASATDKYTMTVAFADHAVSEEGFTFDYVGIATGDNFPDALAAGPALGETRSVMLLTPTTYLDSRVRTSLEDHYASALHVRFLGGLPAVSQAVRNAVIATLQ